MKTNKSDIILETLQNYSKFHPLSIKKKYWGNVDYNVIIGRRDNGNRIARMQYEGKHNEKKVL